MRTELSSVLLLTATSLVPMAAGAAQDCGGSDNGRANQASPYNPNLPLNAQVCLVTDHLDTNNAGDPDHRVTSGRQGRWQTSGRVPGGCTVQVKDRGKGAQWRTVATGRNSTFHLVEDKHDRFRVLHCGPRDYSPTAGYGVVKIECKSNAQWGKEGKHYK